MATLQIKRRLAGVPIAAPATAFPGELHFSLPGFIGGGASSLWIDNGTVLEPLVDSQRQVELAGAQSITGIKTFSGGGAAAFTTVANIQFLDGTAGQALMKGPGNSIVWGTAGAAITTVFTDPITMLGDGAAATPVALNPAIFGAGLNWTTPLVTLTQATTLAIGGTLIATAALVNAGTDDATTVTPLGLRRQTGDDAANLVTTAKQIVPAINEMYTAIAALEGVIIYAGSYDATTSTGTYNGQGGIAAGTGPLPVAGAANNGAYLIVTVAGPGSGANEPTEALHVQDWLVSDGTAWQPLHFHQAALDAGAIAVTPPVAGGANVQAALENLETAVNTKLQFVDGLSIVGDGLTALTALTVDLCDGGTF